MTNVSKLRRGHCLALAAVVAALLGGVTAPALAADPGYSPVDFCNQTDMTGWLVLLNRAAPGSREAEIHGWTRLPPNQCIAIDMPEASTFYYYAEAERGLAWSGNDLHLCVERPGPFRRINKPDGPTCSRENYVGLIKAHSATDRTINLHN